MNRIERLFGIASVSMPLNNEVLIGKLSDSAFETLCVFMDRQKNQGQPIGPKHSVLIRVLRFLMDEGVHGEEALKSCVLIVTTNYDANAKIGTTERVQFWNYLQKSVKKSKKLQVLARVKSQETSQRKFSNFRVRRKTLENGWAHKHPGSA